MLRIHPITVWVQQWTLLVRKEKWDWGGDVISLEKREGGKREGGLDSINAKPAAWKSVWDTSLLRRVLRGFFSLFSTQSIIYTWFKEGGLVLCRVVDSFGVFFSRLFEGECAHLNARPQSCPRSPLGNIKTSFHFACFSLKPYFFISLWGFRGRFVFFYTFSWTYFFRDRLRTVVACNSSRGVAVLT